MIDVTIRFVICSGLILWSGVQLSRYGDLIARRTGLGHTWIGVVLLAAVTSLPELVTGASSVALFSLPDIAAGDAIGSCLFNLLILALLDVRHPSPLSARVHQGHILSASFSVLLLALAAVAMVMGPVAPAVGWVGLHSLVFLGVYALAMRTIFAFERSRLSEMTRAMGEAARELTDGEPARRQTTRSIAVRFSVAACVLVGAAAYLPELGAEIADLTGLARSFIGSLFVAAATSFPEIVVSAAAVRIGALDMAVGNLFGSNLFNIAVLGVDDLLYTRGVLLASVSRVHLVALASGMAMTAVEIVGLTYRANQKRYRLAWDELGIVVLYLCAIVLLRVLG